MAHGGQRNISVLPRHKLLVGLSRVGLAICLGEVLVACKPPQPVEADRSTSPDGQRDAVVLEGGVDATSSFSYTVCLVTVGARCGEDDVVAKLYDASRNAEAFGVDAVWQSPSLLRVQYLSAKKAEVLHPTQPLAKAVHVNLQSEVLNPNAAPGAMVKSGG